MGSICTSSKSTAIQPSVNENSEPIARVSSPKLKEIEVEPDEGIHTQRRVSTDERNNDEEQLGEQAEEQPEEQPEEQSEEQLENEE